MKRLTAVLLVFTLLLSACGTKPSITENESIDFGDLEQDVFGSVDTYLKARLLTDMISTGDFSQYSSAQLATLTQQAMDAWLLADESADMMDESASLFINEQTRLIKQDSFRLTLPALFLVVRGSDPATEWAESFTQQYDAIKGAQRLKQLAAQLGTDSKSAYKQLQMAQDILQRDAANAEGDLYQKWQNIMEATKTASKAGLFVVGTIVTAGGSAAAAGGFGLAQSSAVIVSGVDVILDVGTTSSNIILGRDNKVSIEYDAMKNKFAPVSFVFGLNGFSDASVGEKLAFVGDALSDWFYDNKIAGIKLDSKGQVVKGSEWMVDTQGKTDEAIKQELASINQPYPSYEPIDFEDLLESLDFDVDEFLNNIPVTPSPQPGETGSTEVITGDRISGTYRGLLTIYDSEDNASDEDQDESVIYLTLQSDGLLVEDDEESWLMSYDEISQTAYYEESEDLSMTFIFDTTTEITTVEILMEFTLYDEDFTARGTLTRQ